MWFFTPIMSKILSVVTDKELITVSCSRKIGTSIGKETIILFNRTANNFINFIPASLIPMVCLITVGCIAKIDHNIAVVFLTISVTALGAMYSGFLANHIDIAPHFAGTLVAITNFFATIPGIAVPYIVGALVDVDVSKLF